MKNLIDRIEKLEAKTGKLPLFRTLFWNDDDEDELETVIARDREATGFDGRYGVFIGVSGQWVEGPDGKSRWVRPPRAAKRYVHKEPTLDILPHERDKRIGCEIGSAV